MPLLYMKWITREFVKSNPEAMFIFGDNVMRTGLGGQAKSMRGEPNSIGIATKNTPSMDEGAFFSDADPDCMEVVMTDFKPVIAALEEGRIVYVPADGIGTGLSQLPERAPKIHKAIQEVFEVLGKTYGILQFTNGREKAML